MQFNLRDNKRINIELQNILNLIIMIKADNFRIFMKILFSSYIVLKTQIKSQIKLY